MNAINIIEAYRLRGTWAFDDAARGLLAEPFVAGAQDIIEHALNNRRAKRCRLTFSAAAFPGHAFVALRGMPEHGGTWYHIAGMKGWLCPALLKYFDSPPKTIYFHVEPVKETR